MKSYYMKISFPNFTCTVQIKLHVLPNYPIRKPIRVIASAYMADAKTRLKRWKVIDQMLKSVFEENSKTDSN